MGGTKREKRVEQLWLNYEDDGSVKSKATVSESPNGTSRSLAATRKPQVHGASEASEAIAQVERKENDAEPSNSCQCRSSARRWMLPSPAMPT